jgi:hypothetical protein
MNLATGDFKFAKSKFIINIHLCLIVYRCRSNVPRGGRNEYRNRCVLAVHCWAVVFNCFVLVDVNLTVTKLIWAVYGCEPNIMRGNVLQLLDQTGSLSLVLTLHRVGIQAMRVCYCLVVRAIKWCLMICGR